MKQFLKNTYLSLFNHIVNKIPSYTVRHLIYKNIGRMGLGKNSNIQMGLKVYDPWKIIIGDNCVINNDVVLDGRGHLIIGNNVNISPYVKIFTAEHDVNDENFKYTVEKVIIQDYAWISTSAIILPGIVIGKGAVVTAGSVVTKNIPDFTIVGGVPAKVIKERNNDLKYKLNYRKAFH
ncbi:acyltransferase [Caldifermentibacillus hisashii]|uniref:acyltransferase n=1 Tax=Caldifermentibacillus hisashii TaxID=996558 RepID=UPI000BA32D85|nr:acyltransferase [Caldifermentibacillus hisashii]PAC34377.1 acetyltransferase [Caldifermentibacillus hisashii]